MRAALEAGNYRITNHANDRMGQWGIFITEVLHVLRKGRHNKRKDKFCEIHETWNYAVDGTDLDGEKKIRVIWAFDEDKDGKMVILVTVIDLDKD